MGKNMGLKEEKRSYSLLQNVTYVLKHMWKWNKKDVGWLALSIPGGVMISLLETCMTKDVVQLVTELANPVRLLIHVLLFSLGLLLLYSLKNAASVRVMSGCRIANDRFALMYQDRYMQVDYEKLEHPEFQTCAERAINGVEMNQVSRMMEKTASLFAAIVGLIAYAIILIPVSPVIVPVMVVISTAGYFLYGYNHKWERTNRDTIWAPVWKRMDYNSSKIRDPQSAKDIRLFDMRPLLAGRFQETLTEFIRKKRHGQIRWKAVDTIFACMTAARDILAYGILIYKVYSEGMSAALDPISEFDIYSRFNQMVEDKTAIFISHRLSSCRFCDEIVVMDSGNIIQMGNHESLVKDKEGKYYELWNAQAQYYNEEQECGVE